MIEINKETVNYVDLTLTEKATLDSPYYLFVFKSDLERAEVIFTGKDISTEPQRYNRFLVYETSGTNNLTSGVVTLNPTGFWTYKAYEQTSQTNLDVANTTSLVEQGKVKVIGDPTTHNKHIVTRRYNVYGKGSG